MQKQTVNLSTMAAKWPCPYVARSEIGRFSGGILNPRSMANIDCRGEGPAGRIRVGRKVAYPVQAVISWLEARAEAV